MLINNLKYHLIYYIYNKLITIILKILLYITNILLYTKIFFLIFKSKNTLALINYNKNI